MPIVQYYKAHAYTHTLTGLSGGGGGVAAVA